VSVRVMSLVYGCRLRNRAQFYVLQYLANCCDDGGGSCFPSIERIAAFTRCCERTVINALKELEQFGFIDVIRGDGRGNHSQYVVNVEKLRDFQDCTLSKRKRVQFGTENGAASTEKGAFCDNPLNGRNVSESSVKRDARAMPPRAGANGELMLATWLLEELGLAGGPYDLETIAKVIRYVARDAPCDIEKASKTLLDAARAAIESGELVNVFWFKDRRFAQGKVLSQRERAREAFMRETEAEYGDTSRA